MKTKRSCVSDELLSNEKTSRDEIKATKQLSGFVVQGRLKKKGHILHLQTTGVNDRRASEVIESSRRKQFAAQRSSPHSAKNQRMTGLGPGRPNGKATFYSVNGIPAG